MTRIATVVLLSVLNIAVWLRPAEALLYRATGLISDAPTLERAERYTLKGDLANAQKTYAALVETSPGNGTYRLAYGSFCHINSAFLREELGWTLVKHRSTVTEELYKARLILSNDARVAKKYAYAMVDSELFGPELPLDRAAEAWEHVLSLARENAAQNANDITSRNDIGFATLQLVRVELIAGDTAAAGAHVADLRAEMPEFRVPRELEAKMRIALDEQSAATCASG